MVEGSCHHCGKHLEFVEKVFRNDTCPYCGSDAHCCLNCAEFDESRPNQCRESQSEKVSVRDRRNYCSFFTLTTGSGSSKSADKAAAARSKLDALFKK